MEKSIEFPEQRRVKMETEEALKLNGYNNKVFELQQMLGVLEFNHYKRKMAILGEMKDVDGCAQVLISNMKKKYKIVTPIRNVDLEKGELVL